MRRSQKFLFGVLLLLITLPVQARAEEGTISAGLKTWFSVLDFDEPGVPKSDTTLSWGPTVSYSKGNRFWGLSFVKGEYDFDGGGTAERSETDVFTGLQVTSNLALVVGGKHELISLEAPDGTEEDVDVWLTVFGARAHKTFGTQNSSMPVTLFGTVSLVDGEFSGEIGGSVPLPETSFSLYGGYKHQEVGDVATVSGLFLGLNYSLD